MKIQLENIRISEYIDLLRSGAYHEEVAEIENELSSAMGNLGGSFDVGLFLLNKDLLIFQCKLAIAIFEFNEKKQIECSKKIDELKTEIRKRTKKTENSTPYKNFLNWILAVEKYLGFSIDKNNDLLYLVEATNQMLKYYANQKEQIEQQKAKK
jgi:hypothetical protein